MTLPDETFPEILCESPWVVYCKPALQGRDKVLQYLGRYIHRVAITNRRIKAIRNGKVSFEFKDSRASRWKTMTLPAEEFIRRFLQHVLPRGFHNVHYYGLLSPRKRTCLKQLQYVLAEPVGESDPEDSDESPPANTEAPNFCPACQAGILVVITWLPPQGRSPP